MQHDCELGICVNWHEYGSFLVVLYMSQDVFFLSELRNSTERRLGVLYLAECGTRMHVRLHMTLESMRPSKSLSCDNTGSISLLEESHLYKVEWRA